MAKLVENDDKVISGPWLLNIKALEELDGVLENIKQILKSNFEKEYDESDDEMLEHKLFYINVHNHENVLIRTKEGKTIKDTSLLPLLKDSHIDNLTPTRIESSFVYGESEFHLIISSGESDELNIQLYIDDIILSNEINYQLDKWIDKHKPNIIVQKWNHWSPGITLISFFILFITLFSYLPDKGYSYKQELKKQSSDLLKDGISTDETVKAIELILKLESDHLPENYKSEGISFSEMLWWIVAIVGTVIVRIRPVTIIGVGKNKAIVSFYQNWIYFVLIIIPLSIILPLLLDKI